SDPRLRDAVDPPEGCLDAPEAARPERRLLLHLGLLQLERCRVDAVAEPGRARAVREYVPKVAAARGAEHLGAHHPVARVDLLRDRLAGGGRGERGPPAARVVLRVGGEELGSAAGAVVGARLEHVVVLAGERALGALLAQHAVLL